jgi:hypothetical protein
MAVDVLFLGYRLIGISSQGCSMALILGLSPGWWLLKISSSFVPLLGVVAQINEQVMTSPAPGDRYTWGFLTGRPRRQCLQSVEMVPFYKGTNHFLVELNGTREADGLASQSLDARSERQVALLPKSTSKS